MIERVLREKQDGRTVPLSLSDDYTANGGTVKEIEAWMNDVWATICDYGSDDYLDFIDLDSWAKEYILQELYKNYNVICGSILMYREGTDPDDKLIFGPVWDLDGSMGHTSTNPYCGIPSSEQHTADNWYIDSIGTNKYDNKTVVAWLQELGKHESFIKRVYEVYNENKDYFDGEVNGILHNLDVQKELLTDSAAMNFNRWKIDNSSCTSTYSRDTSYGSGVYAITYKKTTDFNSHVENLRTYLTKRLAYLSDNLTVAAPIGTITGATTVAVGDGLTLTADCAADSYQWQSSTDGEVWTNIDGAAGKIYSVTALYSMNGLHIRCVAKNMGNLINTTRVAKVAPAASVILAPVTLTVTLEGHEHSYADVVTTPTCTEKGYTTYTCPCEETEGRFYRLCPYEVLSCQIAKPLEKIFKGSGTSYAYYYNRNYDLCGYLFQYRFRSKPVGGMGEWGFHSLVQSDPPESAEAAIERALREKQDGRTVPLSPPPDESNSFLIFRKMSRNFGYSHIS